MKLENITSESWTFIPVRTEKLSQGTHLWYKECPYPRRVFNDPNWGPNHFLRVLEKLGIVKKYIFALTFLKNIVIPRTLNIKKWEPFLENLAIQIDWTLAEFYIKDNEYSVPVWGIGIFIKRFLEELGLNKNLARVYAKIAMMILEFDNAYRYRIQDMFGAVDMELFLYNPSKWIKKALEIYTERELTNKNDINFGARGKILKMEFLVKILWIPKIKKAWKKAASEITYGNICFGDDDRFHISYWVGYNFEGKTFEQRFKPVEHIFEKIPFQKRDDRNEINNFLIGL